MDIVFDLGNVVFEWNPQKLADNVFENEIDRKEAVEKIIFHNDWQLLDKGTLDLEDAISRANERCLLGTDKIRKLFQETPKYLTPIQETFGTIKELNEKGYHLYVLSNMHKHAFEHLSSAYNIWGYFSGIVISSHIKSMKPEPEIYEYLIRTHGIIPSKAVFLDDIESNIETAKMLGFKTIHVRNPFQSREALYLLLGI